MLGELNDALLMTFWLITNLVMADYKSRRLAHCR